ncbi:uncharacterized protein [Nicotiana sylvestris]|uniref:uncharacterized protein n=1 Tax=Nicotiana sylvestris TaxID=4096 RepID=UPI00388CD32A
MKILSEAYVPSNITGGEMANMVGQVLESHKITFHEDELPPEGLSHNKTLHITVQCEDHFITRILVDGGSSLNICPLITLRTLGKGLHEIKDGAINVKAFDGSHRSTLGEISLCLQMGPTWFDIDFQVIEVQASYNLLMGRPWIHATGAVASTLHQAVKFEWNNQEVIIHGNGSNPIHSRQTIPMIGGRRRIGGETYHHIERVNAVDKDKWWGNKIESILNWSGYEPGKGLGKNLQGITKPIQLKKHGTTFDLGYEYTWEEFKEWSPPWRSPYYPLEQPLPQLEQTFQPADTLYGSEEDEALAAMKNLFLEEDMDCCVIFEEKGEEGLSIQAVNQGERLTNCITITYLDDEPTTVTCNEAMQQTDIDLEEDDIPEEVVREIENFENRPKSNLDETEVVNLGDTENVKETCISVHLSQTEKKEYTEFLREYEDIFAWSYDESQYIHRRSQVANRSYMSAGKAEAQKIQARYEFENQRRGHQAGQSQSSQSGRVSDLIWMDEEDAEKTTFITPWGMYCYRMMPFGLKNASATYMRAMTTIFHDMIHKEIEVYVEDVIIKSRKTADHMEDLQKNFNRLRRFIAQSTVICEPIFKMLKKDAATKWTDECQKAFDRVKEYLSMPPVLVPLEPGRPLLLYLVVLDGEFGCILGQHDETGRKEQAIYYLSKKFTSYEARYSLLERTYCALTWVAEKLRHYFCAYTTYLISRMDPLKYIFQKPMPTSKLAKWQILLSEFDIVYVTQNAVKGQALADHLAENPVGGEYEPLKTYFPNEEVAFIGEDISESYDGWRMFFDGAANFKGVGIGAVLVSETGQHYPVSAKLRFPYTNNMAEYEACILGLKLAIDMNIQELLVIGDSDLLIHQVRE